MTESRIEKLTRIGQEMAAVVDEMRAEAVDLTPDLTTKLAIRQIEGEAAWWRSVDFDRNASRTFESMTGDSQQAVRTGVERVLAHLTAAGRLIPAGGMALTAEDVRKFIIAIERHYPEGEAELLARLRALFPATEPAEDAPCAICNVNETNHAGVSYCHPFTTELGPFDDEGNDRPAPAEPAEEETKADTSAIKRDAWFKGYDACRQGDQRHNPHPTSSSVVPAPTETGPWPSLNDVPPTVRKVKDVKGHEWLRREGSLEWFGCGEPWNSCRVGHLSLAPFVAAEGN